MEGETLPEIHEILSDPLGAVCPWCDRPSNLSRQAAPYRGQRPVMDWLWAATYACPACQGLMLVFATSERSDGSGVADLAGVVPYASKPAMDGVPEDAGADRDEGWRAFHGGLNKGAALLARSALEATTKHLEA
jgi:hypothetical protein